MQLTVENFLIDVDFKDLNDNNEPIELTENEKNEIAISLDSGEINGLITRNDPQLEQELTIEWKISE